LLSIQALSAAIMRVRLTDQALLPDLLAYLRSTECVAEQAGPDELNVLVPRAPSDEQARREVDIYLRAWQAMHPGTGGEILD
jgi:hypothetical protein